MTRGARRILLATWDGGGVIPPQLAVCRELVARGHQVHVLADPTVRPEAEAAGCRFLPWTTAPHRLTRDRSDDILPDYAAKNPLAYMDLALERFMRDPGPRWVADSLQAIEQTGAELVLTDSAVPWVVLAAQVAALPSAVLHTTIYTLPTPGLPPAGFGLAPARNAVQRGRDAVLRRLSVALWNRALGTLNAVRAAHGLGPLPGVLDQVLACDRFLVLSSPSFDLASPHVPAHVRWVGPRLADPTWIEANRPALGEDDSRPLVLVAFSSTFQDHIGVLRRVVAALSDLPVRGIVTLGPSLHPDELAGTDNVRVVQSAPHADLLRLARVVVTHGGHGTVIKALAAGVPVVCLPLGRDQPDVAARLVVRSAGLRLDKQADTRAIAQAVTRALEEPELRRGAEAQARAIASGAGCTSALDELEGILGRP